MKKPWIAILVVILISVIVCYAKETIDAERVFIKTTAAQEEDKTELANYLYAQKLELAKKGMFASLKDYTIEKTEVYDGALYYQDEFLDDSLGEGLYFTVRYSVLPAYNNSDWIAGNGVMGDDGWIYHKFSFVIFQKDSGGWRLVNEGTGP